MVQGHGTTSWEGRTCENMLKYGTNNRDRLKYGTNSRWSTITQLHPSQVVVRRLKAGMAASTIAQDFYEKAVRRLLLLAGENRSKRRMNNHDVARWSLDTYAIPRIAAKFLNMTKPPRRRTRPPMAETSCNVARLRKMVPDTPIFTHRRWSYDVLRPGVIVA